MEILINMQDTEKQNSTAFTEADISVFNPQEIMYGTVTPQYCGVTLCHSTLLWGDYIQLNWFVG